MRLKIVMLLLVLVFLVGCITIEEKKSETGMEGEEDEAFAKCYKAFMSGNGTTPDGKDLPPYIKEPIAKEFCKRMIEESKKQVEGLTEMIYGVFANQGIVLPREGGAFDIEVRNNDGAGDFTLELEKTMTRSGNDISYELAEKSFSLEA